MKCPNCGAENENNAKFCKKCGTVLNAQPHKSAQQNEKSDGKTKVVLVVLIIVAAAILLFFIFANYYEYKHNGDSLLDISGRKEKTTEAPSDKEEKNTKTPIAESSSSSESDQTTTTSPDRSALDGLDVETEVSSIRDIYNSIVQDINNGNLTAAKVADGVTAYKYGDAVEAIYVDKGVDGNAYSRKYYFGNHDMLIFAYLEADDSHRLYFKDGLLFRWRYCSDAGKPQDAVNHDLENSDDYNEMESFALDESDKYLTDAENVSSVPQVSSDKISGATATSELYEDKYKLLHGASNILDGDSNTAWSEAASGTGRGESVTINLSEKCQVSGISIMSGYQKTERLFKRNCRPSRLTVTFSDGESEVIDLKDSMGWQKFTFSNPHDTTSVTLTIDSVYKGSVYKDTLITDVELN